MSILTVAKGVYVIKPKLEGSRAADYMERWTRAQYKQTEMAFTQAQQEIKSAEDRYKEQLALYSERLKTLNARQATLEDQYRKQNFDIAEYNAKATAAAEKEKIAAQNRRDERKGEMKVARTATTKVSEAPPGKVGTTAETKPTKLTDKDRKSTRLNSSHVSESRMPSSA